MKLEQLIDCIQNAHRLMQGKAAQSINTALTLRNWLIGYQIIQFEQKGKERARYGDKLLETLAKRFKQKKIAGLSVSNLGSYRQFYLSYPQIPQTLSGELKSAFANPAIKIEYSMIPQTASGEFKINPQILLDHLTFSHFLELLKVTHPTKRAFYESLCVKSNWSVRELKRQIGSLLFERTAKSKIKKTFLDKLQSPSLTPEQIIKNPYVFEFLGLEEKSEHSEDHLETALINHLQKFLIELGKGFCFEARQKRITVNNQHYYMDLVFYHRILKCHVLIDLKIREFAYTDAGQMNFYLNYMKANEMEKGDNPPVGIVLCTHDNKAEVKYATAGLNNRLFVSRYMLQLPTEKELKKFIRKDLAHLNNDEKENYGND